MKKKYSIILPVRNGGEYLKICVSSILQQTLNNFNLIILDNCSTDGSLEWIKALHDKRIVLHESETSLTIEENWARITQVEKNEFITLTGHDDVFQSNFLEVIDKLIEKNLDASLYQTHFNYIDAKGTMIRRCMPMDAIQTGSEYLAFLLSNTIDIMGTGYVMRSKDYDALGGIPPYPNLLFADLELWINAASKTYKAVDIKETVSFRKHISTTTISADVKFQQAFFKFLKYLLHLKQKDEALSSVIEKYSLQFINFYAKGLSHRLLRTPKKLRQNISVYSFLQECKKMADLLVPNNDFNPSKKFHLNIANKIDRFSLTRSLFLWFKKIYSKPIYK